MMLDDRIRNVTALPTVPTSAQAKVGVFAVQEEVAIKKTHVFESLPAVKRGAGAGEKNIARRVKCGRGPALSALFAASIAGDEHAGGVQSGGAVEENARSAHTHVRHSFQLAAERCEPARGGFRVIVEGGKMGRLQQAPGEIDGGGETKITLAPMNPYGHRERLRGQIIAQFGLDNTRAAVIDHQHPEVRFSLQ